MSNLFHFLSRNEVKSSLNKIINQLNKPVNYENDKAQRSRIMIFSVDYVKIHDIISTAMTSDSFFTF